MKLYLVRVEATSITDVRFGDRVSKGQTLGTEVGRDKTVVSPANGIIRHISLEDGDRAKVIHILSKEDEDAELRGRLTRPLKAMS